MPYNQDAPHAEDRWHRKKAAFSRSNAQNPDALFVYQTGRQVLFTRSLAGKEMTELRCGLVENSSWAEQEGLSVGYFF